MTEKNSEMPRAKVIGITLEVIYPNGKKDKIKVDPSLTNCLFWDDQSILKVYAPFYDKFQSKMTKNEFIDRFGKEAKKIIEDQDDPFQLTSNIIEKLWDIDGPEGYKKIFALSKTTDCTPR
ncbi:MAG: hypothetical protein MUF15_19705 [Acidobacteria bacterium]|jgi:hypothetical protein|nr:hypothetical protein [Acidobacteriota bacterium]